MSATRRDTIVVAGALARRPGVGGHAWALLAWLLGLRALGYHVVFIDALDPDADTARQWSWTRRVLDECGFEGAYAVLDDDRTLGMSRAAVRTALARSTCLLNIMGYLRDDDLLAAAQRRVFVDIDPGYPQMWCALGLHDGFAGHDAFVTVGSRIGRGDCLVPTCGREWITTLPPVALEWWPVADGMPPRAPITSVATWRGPDGNVEFEGRTYGTRVHEFRRFLALPQRSGGHFELALAIDPADEADRAALCMHGWRLIDPRRVAGDMWSYRAYVEASAMEVMIPKAMYARAASGWFSDRSACYLASGRPVLAADTGIDQALPVGQGVVTFGGVDEAAEAVAEVRGNYVAHAKAARAIAEDLLDARVVVASVLERVGVR